MISVDYFHVLCLTFTRWKLIMIPSFVALTLDGERDGEDTRGSEFLSKLGAVVPD